jgi:hypothetical protein
MTEEKGMQMRFSFWSEILSASESSTTGLNVAGTLDWDVSWCGSTDSGPHHPHPQCPLGKFGML